MLKKLLERIESSNQNVYANIKSLKKWYSANVVKPEVVRAEVRGYLMGLQQLGFITERERQLLVCYITL